MGILDLVLSLVPVIPAIAKLVAGDTAEDIAKKVISIAESITGKEGKEAIEEIHGDENHQCDFKCQIESIFGQTDIDQE